MAKGGLNFKEFDRLLKEARCQFLLKAKQKLYFLPFNNYTSYNEHGFIAHNEITGEIDILDYKDVVEITIDSKKYYY